MSKEAKELAGITERARIARESMAAVDVYDLQIATLRRERDEAREALRAMNDFLEKIQQATTDFLVPDGMTQHAYINEIIDLQDRALAAIRQLKDRTP
jgi:DNA gyrase/topoisomerase IV subunit A